jgi:hypothetical protein
VHTVFTFVYFLPFDEGYVQTHVGILVVALGDKYVEMSREFLLSIEKHFCKESPDIDYHVTIQI